MKMIAVAVVIIAIIMPSILFAATEKKSTANNAEIWNALPSRAKYMYVIGFEHGISFKEAIICGEKDRKCYACCDENINPNISYEKIIKLIDALYSTDGYESCPLEGAMSVSFMNAYFDRAMKDFWGGVDAICPPKKGRSKK